MARSRWRRWNNLLHRDIGYLAVGLTVAYALSGLAVNHAEQWNADYRVEVVEHRFEPADPTDRAGAVDAVSGALGLPDPKSTWWTSGTELELYYPGQTVRADVARGLAWTEVKTPRWMLKPLNDAHLNRLAGVWTVVADLYAVALLVLAITGMFVLRGRKGLSGRGKWLVGAGVAVPLGLGLLAAWL